MASNWFQILAGSTMWVSLRNFLRLFGGLDPRILSHNREVLELAVDGTTLEAPRYRLLVGPITSWTLLIEGILAVTWLAPARSLPGRQRHWLTLQDKP